MIYEGKGQDCREYRIWSGELPFGSAAAKCRENTVSACVEIRSGRQINNNYALIGGIFLPDGSGQFSVRITAGETADEIYATGLCGAGDVVHKGIAKEYADGILRYEHGFGLSGKLDICCGAAADIGSSVHCFKIAYRIMLWLLQNDGQQIVSERIIPLFDIPKAP